MVACQTVLGAIIPPDPPAGIKQRGKPARLVDGKETLAADSRAADFGVLFGGNGLLLCGCGCDIAGKRGFESGEVDDQADHQIQKLLAGFQSGVVA